MSKLLYARLVAILMKRHAVNEGNDVTQANAVECVHSDVVAEKKPTALALQRAITENILRQRGVISPDLRR